MIYSVGCEYGIRALTKLAADVPPGRFCLLRDILEGIDLRSISSARYSRRWFGRRSSSRRKAAAVDSPSADRRPRSPSGRSSKQSTERSGSIVASLVLGVQR